MIETIVDGSSPAVQFIFAHGAGAPMVSPFMRDVAKGMGALGIEVVRFEFPYMAARKSGKKRPPDREAVLRDTWKEIIEQRRDKRRIFIGGKSMGGRFATMIADEAGVDGVVVFGYPFHPPGKPESTRTAHLESMKTPTLIIQGTRDALGSKDDVSAYKLSRKIRVEWIEDGDHSLKTRAGSGMKPEEAIAKAVKSAADFMG